MRTYKIVAHRGASAYEPENTLRSVRKAIELRADMIEVDVRSTKDDQLVVIHDAEVDRTTNGSGVVKDMTLREIRDLDAGEGEKVPTLEEVLRLSRNKIGVITEVKSEGIEKLLVDLASRENSIDQVIVTSFMTGALRRIKELSARTKIGLIFSWKIPDAPQKALELRTSYMLPQHELVTAELVKELHACHVSLFAWTVDDVIIAEKLIKIGVDGIVTNKPDLLPRPERAFLGTRKIE